MNNRHSEFGKARQGFSALQYNIRESEVHKLLYEVTQLI